MSAADLGGGFWAALRRGFSAPLAIYGLMVYTVLIGVIADDSEHLGEVFVGTILTQVIFYAAHVFAHTLGEHADRGLRDAVRHAARHSAGMLYAPIPVAAAIGIGALAHADPEAFVDVALGISTGILALLGYLAYAQRTRNLALRLLGALGTALLGMLIMLIEYLVH